MNIKSFGMNTLIYAFGNIGLRSVSFLTLPMYTHFLSLREYGMLATLLITMQPLIVFMNMGMRVGLVRFTKEYELKNKTNVLLGTTTVMNTVGGFVMTAVLVTLCLPVFRKLLQAESITGIIILTCTGAFAQSICIHLSAFYRAHNRPMKFLLSSLMAAVFTCSLTYLLTGSWHLGIEGALTATTMGYSLVAAVVLIDILSEAGSGFSFNLIPQLLRFSLPLLVCAWGYFIIWGTSIYFLSYFQSLEVVAIYSLGYRLTQILGDIVILPFQLSFQPFIFSQLDSEFISRAASRLFTYLLLCLGVISFVLLIAIRLLLPYIAPPEYASAFNVVLFLLPGVAFIGVYYFAETILGAVHKTSILATFMMVFALVSVASNLVLIPSLGWWGAALSSDISFILLGCTLLRVAQTKIAIPYEARRIVVIGMTFCFLFLFAFVLNSMSNLFFYAGMFMFFCVSAYLFYTGSFMNEQERTIVRYAFSKVRSAVSVTSE